MMKMMSKMMDCEKNGQLMEQSAFEKLGWWKKRKLKFHLGMCKKCQKYENDNRILAKVIKMAGSKHCASALSEIEKAEIKSKLERQ